jgi:hypothetical protein
MGTKPPGEHGGRRGRNIHGCRRRGGLDRQRADQNLSTKKLRSSEHWEDLSLLGTVNLSVALEAGHTMSLLLLLPPLLLLLPLPPR